jgi:hypothetical protein
MLVIHPNPDSGALAHPSIFEMVLAKECIPTHYPSFIFIFGLTIESIEELRGVSIALIKPPWFIKDCTST